MLKVGSLQNGTGVFISDKSPNRHISVLGISGSGKTVRLKELIRNVVENGETALIFDINGTDYKDCIDRDNSSTGGRKPPVGVPQHGHCTKKFIGAKEGLRQCDFGGRFKR